MSKIVVTGNSPLTGNIMGYMQVDGSSEIKLKYPDQPLSFDVSSGQHHLFLTTLKPMSRRIYNSGGRTAASSFFENMTDDTWEGTVTLNPGEALFIYVESKFKSKFHLSVVAEDEIPEMLRKYSGGVPVNSESGGSSAGGRSVFGRIKRFFKGLIIAFILLMIIGIVASSIANAKAKKQRAVQTNDNTPAAGTTAAAVPTSDSSASTEPAVTTDRPAQTSATATVKDDVPSDPQIVPLEEALLGEWYYGISPQGTSSVTFAADGSFSGGSINYTPTLTEDVYNEDYLGFAWVVCGGGGERGTWKIENGRLIIDTRFQSDTRHSEARISVEGDTLTVKYEVYKIDGYDYVTSEAYVYKKVVPEGTRKTARLVNDKVVVKEYTLSDGGFDFKQTDYIRSGESWKSETETVKHGKYSVSGEDKIKFTFDSGESEEYFLDVYYMMCSVFDDTEAGKDPVQTVYDRLKQYERWANGDWS